MSTSTQIKSEVEQLEKALRPILEQLDNLYREFATALPAYVETWMRKHVEGRIEENADAVNLKGVESLRLLKADLSALIARLPTICADAIGSPATWPHRAVSTSDRPYGSRSTESAPAAAFRKAICPVADVLEKHGLLKTASGRASDWEGIPGQGYRYAFNPGFEERQFAALKQYNDVRIQLTKDSARLQEKRKELARATARELWGEA